jgi:hypothetical protein
MRLGKALLLSTLIVLFPQNSHLERNCLELPERLEEYLGSHRIEDRCVPSRLKRKDFPLIQQSTTFSSYISSVDVLCLRELSVIIDSLESKNEISEGTALLIIRLGHQQRNG